ncbi:MAG: hypothetical protein CMH64_02880 [Nanoarchaeota archaeon]|nr:hypothetical protein [Nanoarchaeota archaeon]|tara:strand:+ start:883 stop:1281 length:399 start_codon:yes stop_codon:yes gene_type:complete
MIIRKKAVKIFLINPKREMLMQLRDDIPSIPNPGFWGLIGGEVENGESSLEAIKREIKEEINCPIKNITLLKEVDFPDRNVHITYFKGDISTLSSEIELTEGQEVRYFPFKEIYDLKIPTHLRQFLSKNEIF